MPKRRKEIHYECPFCHKKYPASEKTPVLTPTGETKLVDVKIRTCKSCGTNLVRRVKKLPKERAPSC